ncbi:MAG: tetratricopeptide repeat protein [Deltaproteobacteria bacterium]|nr:MAG: tetratricopeptide repeat protein [Deltaproteobacteria bacterium]
MKKKDLAIDLLEMALARRDEPAALATALIALDKLSQSRPDHANCHYAAGRILLVMSQPQLAMGALRVACELDPGHALAHYYEGVAHWLLGDRSRALTKILHALNVDPDLFDARYDAAVIYYQRGDYVAALEHLKRALELRPDDFPTLKKLLQCLLGLDHLGTAQLTHQRLRQVWATSEDPAVRGLRSYVLDQFRVGPLRVVAVESLLPEGDPAVLYSFAAHDDVGLAFTVTLETSAALREAEGGWVLAISDREVHAHTATRWADPPGYHVLKPAVVQTIKRWAGLGDEAD